MTYNARANDALCRMKLLNDGWRYLRKPEAQAAFGRRIGRERMEMLKASLKEELDALASIIIDAFPLEASSDENMILPNPVAPSPAQERLQEQANERQGRRERPRLVPMAGTVGISSSPEDTADEEDQ